MHRCQKYVFNDVWLNVVVVAQIFTVYRLLCLVFTLPCLVFFRAHPLVASWAGRKAWIPTLLSQLSSWTKRQKV